MKAFDVRRRAVGVQTQFGQGARAVEIDQNQADQPTLRFETRSWTARTHIVVELCNAG